MRYEHISGVTIAAKFAWEGELRYRYRMEIALQSKTDGKTACVVMQNPSYAGEDVADKSVQFMEKVIFKKGLPEFNDVSRLIVVNQFARIQTNNFQGFSHDIGTENDAAIDAALRESDIIIIGWGSGNRFDERKAYILSLIKKMSGKPLFQTKMHPSRGRYEGFIQPLSI